ncbi:MarC family protein [Shimia biformata]|uniref:MarC family protein n=1 Tax=Shimia biformata TaxID=1294299 RepID=UPI00194F3B84|nr:MarC family protein [Shimia biformata]
MDTSFAITFFGALFAIMNPFMVLPIFLSMTDGIPVEQQRRVGIKAVIYCVILGLAFTLAGSAILNLFGISVDDFRVAGGLVVLLIALNMLNGDDNSAHSGTEAEQQTFPDPDSIAFYPLTFPMIFGPGTIATLIVFAHSADTREKQVAFAGVFAIIIAILALTLFNAALFGKRLSATARVIMSRLMGMILAAIAVAMMTDGLRELLPGLA